MQTLFFLLKIYIPAHLHF